MKCHIRLIGFEIRFEFESLLLIRFLFDSNANGRFAGSYPVQMEFGLVRYP